MTGPALITPDMTAALWGMELVAVAWPGRTAGLSGVVSAGCRARDLGIASPADPATHLVAVSLRPHHAALALAIGNRLLRAHPGLEQPALRHATSLSAREEALLQALLIEAGGAGLADIAAELDRPQSEVASTLGLALRSAPPDICASFARRRPS